MRTNNWMRHLAWGVLGLVSQQAFSQVTIDNNNGLGGAFVGWNALANQILDVKNEADQSIDLYTSNIRRFRLLPNGGYLGLGSFAFIPAPGYALLSPNVNQFYANGAPGPYSLLHLADATNNAQQQSYRPWMKIGITMTGNDDHSYFGQKASSLDFTDVVLHWSDNPGKSLKDRMRFIFTSAYSGAATGSGSVEGLEGMRLFPVDGDNVNVGLGDFFAAQTAVPMTVTEPTERLDLLNGRVRLRDLPTDNEGTGLTKFLVVDDVDPATGEYGVVKWRTLPDPGPGGADCDWTMQSSNSVSTAYAGNSGCPQFPDGVGVGLQEPKAKLHVYYDHSEGDNIMGNASILGEHRADEITGVAVHGNAHPWNGFNPNFAGVANDQSSFPSLGTSRTYTGVLGTAGSGLYSIGVEGVAANADEGIAKDLLGVVGRSLAEESSVRCVGVYGFAKGAESGNDWAGWFDGLTFCTTGVFQASDAQLKTNIEALSGATAILSELEPKTYEFNIEEYPFLGTDAGRHHGLLADDLAEVVPGAVREAVRPEQYDNDGVLVASELAFKAVNYQELIPILIAGFNEQRERIDRLESQLAACCSDPDGGRANSQGTENGLLNDPEIDRKLQIIPNPFQTETTIHYNLEKGGRVQLMANSADGKQLQVLYEQVSESGVYQFNWHTEDLAAGMYYVTLLLDGEAITKRAVKIDR